MTRRKAKPSEGNGLTVAGVVVVRVLVPLWLALGVILALANGGASHLPASLVMWLGPLGVNLLFVMYFGAAVELTVIALSLSLPAVGRVAQLVLLTIFVPILVGDIALGASSCGCFGAVQVSPWITLTIDVLLLFGVIWVGGRPSSQKLGRELPTWRVLWAGVLVLAAFAVSFGWMTHRSGNSVNHGGEEVDDGMERVAELPDYYLPDYGAWLGRQWSDIPIAPFMIGDLAGIEEGRRYLVFYRKDCEHCHELMTVFFNEQLPGPTTAVAVPEKTGFPTVNVQPFECDACALAELPAGCDWFMQTPVLVRLQDGVVECAAEVSAAEPQCLVF